MRFDSTSQIGVLHPGAMGISVAVTIKNAGIPVLWASQGRSDQTRQRASEHGLIDAGSLNNLCTESALIVSVCPPTAAEAVAESVVAHGFSGIYLDANAI